MTKISKDNDRAIMADEPKLNFYIISLIYFNFSNYHS